MKFAPVCAQSADERYPATGNPPGWGSCRSKQEKGRARDASQFVFEHSACIWPRRATNEERAGGSAGQLRRPQAPTTSRDQLSCGHSRLQCLSQLSGYCGTVEAPSAEPVGLEKDTAVGRTCNEWPGRGSFRFEVEHLLDVGLVTLFA